MTWEAALRMAVRDPLGRRTEAEKRTAQLALDHIDQQRRTIAALVVVANYLSRRTA